MKRKHSHERLEIFLILAFTLLSFGSSFATTTTYEYDDLNHKVTIKRGTPGAVPTYSISGIVTDNNGNPFSGVTISLTGGATSSMTTDSNGFYGFSGLSNGSYTVTPTKAGYTFSPVNRTVSVSGGDVIGQNFTSSLAAIYSISGTVTSGGSGLSGVTMTLSGTGSGTTTTDGSGNYSFNNLTNGSYTVTPSKTGYTFSPTSINTTINGAEVTGQNFTASCGYSSVRLARATPVYYTSLQAAYNAAVSGDIIQSQAITFTENLSINRNITVTLQGGYDCGYTSNSGNISLLKGKLQTYVGGGTLTITNFKLTP